MFVWFSFTVRSGKGWLEYSGIRDDEINAEWFTILPIIGKSIKIKDWVSFPHSVFYVGITGSIFLFQLIRLFIRKTSLS
jgi:hypothetical protein